MSMQKIWMSTRDGSNGADKLTKALFIIYLIVLVWILLFKLGVRFSYMENRVVNLIPFGGPLTSNGKIDYPEIILNVLIFVPLGIYSGILLKSRAIAHKIFFFFLISFLIEGLQFIFRAGAFDITDLITNISGGIIGLVIFAVIENMFNNSTRSQKFINIISAIGTVMLVSLLLLLKLNMLPVRYQ